MRGKENEGGVKFRFINIKIEIGDKIECLEYCFEDKISFVKDWK